MNAKKFEAKRVFLVGLLKKARQEGNTGAEKFILAELFVLDCQKVR